jgi:hypothetical protein
MYINFKYSASKGITPGELLILQMCKQQMYEDLSIELEKLCLGKQEHLKKYFDAGLVTFVKGKKDDTIWHKARLSPKGKDLLDDIETPEVIDEDIIIFEWLKKVYLKRGKQVGNAKRCKSHIAYFRVNSGIRGNCLAHLAKEFLDDDEQQQWSIRLDYVFFKAPNAFSTRFDLEESKLYKYYSNNKSKFDAEFEKILNK